MKAFFQAEIMKYRHTFLKGAIILMPLAVVFLSVMLTPDCFAVTGFNWWYIGLYPGLIGILCGGIGGKDQKQKNNTFLSLPCDVKKIWDAKILAGAVMSGMAMLGMLLFTIIMGKALGIMAQGAFPDGPGLKRQLAAGMLIWLTGLWQIPFCLFLSQKMGTFLMLFVHMGSYTIISVVVSLKPWFVFLPGAITSRLMCPVLGILPNGLLAVEGQMTYAPELADPQSLLVGIPAAVFWFLVFWLGSRKCYQRQVIR